jgi:NAD(P)-dependent dehydrogenase (short-subunit alcohol dehydrogenase family)
VNPFDLSGKLAVVTGARRGIGRAMALALAEAGADIIGVSANLEPAGSEIAKQVTALGRSFEAIQTDFADHDEQGRRPRRSRRLPRVRRVRLRPRAILPVDGGWPGR